MTAASTILPYPPRWMSESIFYRYHELTPFWDSWVMAPGSLTRRLQNVAKLAGMHFSVHQYKEGWLKPSLNEMQLLALSYGRFAWVREVALCFDDMPVVVARTVIPTRTIQGMGYPIKSLGRRSLGEYLFRYKMPERSVFELTMLEDNELKAVSDNYPKKLCIGRRSLYRASKKQDLLVAEFFLPRLGELCKEISNAEKNDPS